MEFFYGLFSLKITYIGTYNVRDQLQEVSTDGWFLTLNSIENVSHDGDCTGE